MLSRLWEYHITHVSMPLPVVYIGRTIRADSVCLPVPLEVPRGATSGARIRFNAHRPFLVQRKGRQGIFKSRFSISALTVFLRCSASEAAACP